MRTIPLLIAVALGLAAAPAAAQFSAGPAGFKRDSDFSPWVKKPPEREARPPRDRLKHRRGQRHYYPYAYPYYFYDDRDYYRDDGYEDATPAPPEPAPPETATPAEPPLPPDPQGPLKSTLARGAEPKPPEWQVGEPLPPRLPHVTLDWRRYELPEPEPGRLYARVRRDVLIITAADRVVESIVPHD